MKKTHALTYLAYDWVATSEALIADLVKLYDLNHHQPLSLSALKFKGSWPTLFFFSFGGLDVAMLLIWNDGQHELKVVTICQGVHAWAGYVTNAECHLAEQLLVQEKLWIFLKE